MSSVREFWLTNSKGEKYSLHTLSAFLNLPTGLGYGVTTNVVKLGNSDLITSESYNLPTASGEIIFMGDRRQIYQEYLNFSKFLYHRPIVLHYKTPNSNTSYYCLVRVIDLQKSEVSQADGILHCPIQLYRQTMWYDDNLNVLEAKNIALEGKEYPLYRPYLYGVISTSNIELYNDGVADAPMVVEVDGASTDVMFDLYDEANVKYGATRILGEYDYIKIDSEDLNQDIQLVRNGASLPNAINYQDLTVGDPRQVYVTFLKLKAGRSKLVFNFGSSGFNGTVRISWRNTYVTV